MIETCPIHGAPQSDVPCSDCDRAREATDKPLSNTLFGEAASIDDPASLSFREKELELERQRLELERQKLELESRRLELEAEARSAEPEPKRTSGPIPSKRRSGRPSSSSGRLRKRKTSGERRVSSSGRLPARLPSGRVPSPGAPPRSSSSLVLALLIVGIIILSSTGAALVFWPSRRAPSVALDSGSSGSREETPELAALRRKAESGDGKAMLNLGALHYSGVGAPRDLDEAKRWLQRAAEAGDADVAAKAVMALSQIRAYEEQIAAAERQAGEAQRVRREREADEIARLAALEKESRAREEQERKSREKEASRLAKREAAEHQLRVEEISETLDDVEADLGDPTYESVVAAKAQLAEVLEDSATTVPLRERTTRLLNEKLGAAAHKAASVLLEEAWSLAGEQQLQGALDALDKRDLLGPDDGNAEAVELRTRCKRQLIALEEARRAEENAVAEQARADRDAVVSSLRLEVRKRCERWFALRAPKKLACHKCGGAGQVQCGDCQGKGYKVTIGGGFNTGSGRKTCGRCAGARSLTCVDMGGYDTQGLRMAFWDFVAPSARKGFRRKDYYSAVVVGQELSSVVGSSLTIESAVVDAIEIAGDRAIVSARVRWFRAPWDSRRNSYFSSEESYAITWYRERGKFYVQLGAEASPEALLPEADQTADPSEAGESEPAAVAPEPEPEPEEREDTRYRRELDAKRRSHESLHPVDSMQAEKELEQLRPRLRAQPLTRDDAVAAEAFLARWPRTSHRGEVLELLEPYYLRTGRRWPLELTAKVDSGKTESAIRAALDWLARHQDADGRWDSDHWSRADYRVFCSPKATYNGNVWDRGDARYDVGVTSLSVLAFLSANETHRTGSHKMALDRAIRWLVAQQTENGGIGFSEGESIYNHAVATLALAEALLLTGDEELEKSAQKAVSLCLAAQNPGQGWKYGIRPDRNDTSVTGWMVLALTTAKAAKLEVPIESFHGARNWLDRATSTAGGAGYQTPGGGSSYIPTQKGKFDQVPAMTATAIVSRMALDSAEAKGSVVALGERAVMAERPSWSSPADTRKCNFYYWHHGSLAMGALGGHNGARWLAALRRALLPNQRRSGCAKGSWDPVGEWCIAGGRVYATAINTLALAGHHRHPLAEASRGRPARAAPGSAKGPEPRKELDPTRPDAILEEPRQLLREGMEKAREAIDDARNGRPDAALSALALATARLEKAQAMFLEISDAHSRPKSGGGRELVAEFEVIKQYLSAIDAKLDELEGIREELDDY